MRVSVTAVVVAYGDPESVCACVDALQTQTRPPQEIIVVDNHPLQESANALSKKEGVRVIKGDNKRGFTGGVAAAAAIADSEYIFSINPDALPAVDCLEQLCETMVRHPQAAIVGAQILLPEGSVNAGDNPIHLSGLSWSGNYGQKVEQGPAREVAAVSGAALLIRTSVYAEIGGIADYFLYCDDTDLCWRSRLCGYQVWFCPQARTRHNYVFDKGLDKYRHLERNRLAMVYANYSVRTLLLLAPLLLVCEAAIWFQAYRGGWGAHKLASYRELGRNRQELRVWRHWVQAHRLVDDALILSSFSATINTPFLALPWPQFSAPVLKLYKRLLVAAT